METLYEIRYLCYDYFIDYIFIVFSMDNDLYYNTSPIDKYNDVLKMPDYIKNDYMKYRSDILTLEIFEFFLKKESILQNNKLDDLKNSIKRDLKIKELL